MPGDATRGGSDESSPIGRGRQRDTAGAEDDQARPALLASQGPEPAAERLVTGECLNGDGFRTSCGEPARLSRCMLGPRNGERPLERTRARAGHGMEDDGDNPGHRASLAREAPISMGRVRAYVGIGANLGDAASTLAAGIHALAALPGVRLRGVSNLYATRPVGVLDQPEFMNAVAALDVPAGPDQATAATALLIALKQIEHAFGRRDGVRWGPRELDLDLLVFGRARLSLERPPAGMSLDAGKADRLLVVPHRDAAERLFVLAPLSDLAPGLVPPGWGRTVASARRRQLAVEGPDAVRAVAQWVGTGWSP